MAAKSLMLGCRFDKLIWVKYLKNLIWFWIENPRVGGSIPPLGTI
jgi:hypothetical protein